MSEIILPESEQPEEKQQELKYPATEEDEERFFLMYHMHIQPSEAEAMSQDYRQWLIARFVAQKSMEREMMAQQRLMGQIGPSLKV
jgi:hypothetical protein